MGKDYGQHGPVIPIYSVPIQEACASGDLAQMKNVAEQAEAHLRAAGNVAAALEALKIEIAKLEGGAPRGSEG